MNGVLALSLLVLAAACGHGSESSGPPAAPADRLVGAGDGVVLDPRTHLQWTNRDHDQSLPWEAADRHCRDLRPGWRLPEIDELKTLYDRRFTEPCGDRQCHLDPAIQLREPYVWSLSSPRAGTRFYFDFTTGNRFSPDIVPRLVRRVLCVRPAA